jgi:hypothetical protein
MMASLLKSFRLTSWYIAALVAAPMLAQSLPQVGPTATKARIASAPPWRQKTIRFSDEKVILGLPRENDRSVAHCSDTGTTFIDQYSDSSSPGSPTVPELFSILPSGEVKSLHRMMPSDFTDVSVRDFFAADHTLVTLLEAVKRDDRADTSGPRDIRYFLSLSDYDGSFAKLLSLELRLGQLRLRCSVPVTFLCSAGTKPTSSRSWPSSRRMGRSVASSTLMFDITLSSTRHTDRRKRQSLLSELA